MEDIDDILTEMLYGAARTSDKTTSTYTALDMMDYVERIRSVLYEYELIRILPKLEWTYRTQVSPEYQPNDIKTKHENN